MTSPVKIWRNQKKIASLLGQVGELVTWTIVRVPPDGFSDQAPYPVGIIALENGERVVVQIVDWREGQLCAGAKIKLIVRRIMEPSQDGVIPYGIKAVVIGGNP